MFTIFGYGAPKYDVEAIAMMKEAWGDTGERNLEEIEIIDIRSRDELSEVWKPFIHSHHYRVHNDFYQSWIAKHPRRSCEAMWAQLMDVQFVEDHDIPKKVGFEQMWKWYQPLIDAENIHQS